MSLLARSVILKTASWSPVEKLIRRTFLFRPLVRRFIAGDNLDEAMKAVEELCDRGFFVSLDYLGENTRTETEAILARNAFIDIVDRISNSRHRSALNISIKLTQCGFDISDALVEDNYRQVVSAAEPHDIFVRVDMESSDYTERTLQLVEKMFAEHTNTGTVLQSYLYRSMDDTKRLIGQGIRVRVVKGAYLEPSTVAFAEKSKVDEHYVAMSKLLMKEGHYPAIATHDEAIIRELKAFAASEGIAKDAFEWQMLYGIRRDLQESLLAEGYRVRVYVPFGDQWYPYFTRRLAERPANALFILKSLFRG